MVIDKNRTDFSGILLGDERVEEVEEFTYLGSIIDTKCSSQKQAVELTFSRKKIEIDHPDILFNNIPVKKVDENKHLGIVLDTKLSFSAHIKEVQFSSVHSF